MKLRLNNVDRITISIGSLCVAAILIAGQFGVIPDERSALAERRAEQSESLAMSVTFLIGKHEFRQANIQLDLFKHRQGDLLSAGLRFHDGTLVAETGDHRTIWGDDLNNENDGCYVVPIRSSKGVWGDLELRYEPIFVGYNRFLSSSVLQILMVLVPLVGGACLYHLRQILKYLDPSQVVPSRVRQTFDNFAEGVVLLDGEDRIVLANKVFARYLNKTIDELMGIRLWSLPWDLTDYNESMMASLRAPGKKRGESVDVSAVRGTTLKLKDNSGGIKAIFSVNASPVLDDGGKYKGLMAAFADITPLEQNRQALAETLDQLYKSKEKIAVQNEELRVLATRDPLTGCMNRRTFFDDFERFWEQAKTQSIPLCALMVDIDFFKRINDNYGHSMGDEVLRQMGGLLRKMTREDDVVCRYGGEEFSILMLDASLEIAEAVAERIRQSVSQLEFPEFKITASFGLSALTLGAADPQGMLDQADKCLYVAKRNGRNRVVRYDTVPADMIIEKPKTCREASRETSEASRSTIPYAAVSALHSSLSYRDQQTGAHSVRVSNYAALLAQRVLNPREVYVVEIGALLHDIGKVGVPDAILLKPGSLTKDEWEIMEKHDLIGVEIIGKSFKHEGLTEIVKCHHYRFGGVRTTDQLLWGNDIPIGARILTIVDSFDAMTSDRPYRKGMSISAAVAELRRCKGTQFDPELVEHFVAIVESGILESSMRPHQVIENSVLLSIGEQIERLVEAADDGNQSAFIALAQRLQETAEKSQVTSIADAALRAIDSAKEDQQLANLVQQSFQLLAVCREMRSADTCDQSV